MNDLIPQKVPKVPYDGPKSIKAIFERIVEDARAEGKDHITIKHVETVIRYVFSVRGALKGVPLFVVASIKGFGNFIPDEESRKLRDQYYVDLKKYRAKFSKRMWLNKAILKRSKEKYWEYYNQEFPEIKLGYKMWLKATGRDKLHRRKFKELDNIRIAWNKKEKEKYNFSVYKPWKKRSYHH